jgi:type IV pilus assembly protein PilQ
LKKWLLLFLIWGAICFPFLLWAEEKKASSGVNKQIVSMDFKKIPVRDLLQFIAESMNFNVIMSESITGNVSVHFQNICWQQALDAILEMSGYVKKQKDNMLYIATAGEFAGRQKSLQEAAPVKTVRIKLRHVDVAVVNDILKTKAHILTSFAAVSINPLDNSLWVKETVDNLPLLTQYLQQLDKPEAQLLVTAKIINIDTKKRRELGLNFNQTAASEQPGRLHLSFPQGTANLCLAIASIAQGQLLNLQLDALESAGYSKVIADPKVITQNRKTAIIEAGEEIPYQESTTSGATSISFKKAVLSLKVTPTILPDGQITMNLEINQNKTSSLSVNGTPAIQTQELKTDVVVKDGQTVILGGIYEKADMEFSNGIPGIASLPLIGKLISKNASHCIRKELLIVLTPHLLNYVR